VSEGAHVRVNRRLWNEDADDYQRRNAPQIRDQAFTGQLAWGIWNIPEKELGVLGEVAGLDILEFGCGGAQWSTALHRNGARPVGFDLSERQLAHALALRQETGIAPDDDHAGERLVNDYFGLYRMQDVDGTVEFNLPYGAWIRLFRDCGLVVEDLLEPRPGPDATSTYRDAEDLAWARRWPAEILWRLRKP
jgi:SAM-dependent methyltransferase